MWIQVAVAVEALALVGAAGVLLTKRTHLAFVAGFNTMAVVAVIFAAHTPMTARTVIALAMAALYLARMNWTLVAWSKQTAVSKLNERTPLGHRLMLPFVLANTMGWIYCLPLYFAMRDGSPPGPADAVAVIVYGAGTAVHFGSDYQKRRFKLRPGNSGRLLDTGFWAWCRHPNYFGDFLIYVSFAVLGGSLWGWVAPAANLAQYAFDAIPKNEQWAEQRYGAAWDAYRARTKAFVPFVF